MTRPISMDEAHRLVQARAEAQRRRKQFPDYVIWRRRGPIVAYVKYEGAIVDWYSPIVLPQPEDAE